MQFITIINFYNNSFKNFTVNFLTNKGGDVYYRISLEKEDFTTKKNRLNERKLKKYIKDYFKDELIDFNYISIQEIY